MEALTYIGVAVGLLGILVLWILAVGAQRNARVREIAKQEALARATAAREVEATRRAQFQEERRKHGQRMALFLFLGIVFLFSCSFLGSQTVTGFFGSVAESQRQRTYRTEIEQREMSRRATSFDRTQALLEMDFNRTVRHLADRGVEFKDDRKGVDWGSVFFWASFFFFVGTVLIVFFRHGSRGFLEALGGVWGRPG